MTHKYWQASENPGYGLEVTHLHEALHAAAGIMLGGWCKWIKTRTDGTGAAFTPGPIGWRLIAVWLAPLLIDDLSSGDERWLEWQNPHSRGHAFFWLKKNRRRLLRQAKKLAAEMNGPGILHFKWSWYPTESYTTKFTSFCKKA